MKKIWDPLLSDELPMADDAHRQILNYVKSHWYIFLFTSLSYRDKAACRPLSVQSQLYSAISEEKFLGFDWRSDYEPQSKVVEWKGPQKNKLSKGTHLPSKRSLTLITLATAPPGLKWILLRGPTSFILNWLPAFHIRSYHINFINLIHPIHLRNPSFQVHFSLYIDVNLI